MHQIVFTTSAAKSMEKLDRQIAQRITNAINKLASNPRPPKCKKMVGVDSWRIRIGDWRVIYHIDDGVLKILIVRIGHRREIYD